MTLEAAADWQRPVPPGLPLGYTMIANADYAAGTITDANIQISNVSFDWNGFDNHGSAAVRFINAENILVQGCSFAGGEDGTAFIGCDGAVVNGCTAVNTVNYSYDNWDGPTNTVIENSTAEVAAFAGIDFTARGTAATDDATASNDAAIGNTITGADFTGINVEALSSGSSANHIFIGGNTVAGPGSGVIITGPGTGELVAGNTLSGSMGDPEIEVSNPGFAAPSGAGWQVQDATIAGNTITNATIASGNAAIMLEAQDAGIFDNTVLFGSAPADLWDAGSTVDSAGNTLDNWLIASTSSLWATNVNDTDGPGSQTAPESAQAALHDRRGYADGERFRRARSARQRRLRLRARGAGPGRQRRSYLSRRRFRRDAHRGVRHRRRRRDRLRWRGRGGWPHDLRRRRGG